MTRPILLDAPNTSLFAAVQVDVADEDTANGRRIVGAAPAFIMEGEGENRRMVPLARVEVLCNLAPHDTEARAVWAYEDSRLPNEHVDVQLDDEPARTVGGLKVTR